MGIYEHRATRLNLFKTAGVSAIGLGAAGLLTEEDAWAMESRVDNPLHIVGGKGHVEVTGPITWDTDEVRAMFVAVLVQGNHVGLATSSTYKAGIQKFSMGSTGGFVPGKADVNVTAIIWDNNGKREIYSWPNYGITLA